MSRDELVQNRLIFIPWRTQSDFDWDFFLSSLREKEERKGDCFLSFPFVAAGFDPNLS